MTKKNAPANEGSSLDYVSQKDMNVSGDSFNREAYVYPNTSSGTPTITTSKYL